MSSYATRQTERATFLKVLLRWPIFLAICLTILLRYKSHESLPSVIWPKMNMSRNFLLLPQSLRKVEVVSLSCKR